MHLSAILLLPVPTHNCSNFVSLPLNQCMYIVCMIVCGCRCVY